MNYLTNSLRKIFLTLNLRHIFIIVYFFFIDDSMAQIPRDYGLANWKDAGYTIENSFSNLILNIKDFGAMGDGTTDDTRAVKDAISSLAGRRGVIYFPEGSYKMTQTLTLIDSCELQGAGAKSSKLIFDLQGQNNHCIQAIANPKDSFTPLRKSLSKNTKMVILPPIHHFKQGDHIEIIQDNGDWDSVPAGWASNSVGHRIR